MNWLKLDLKDGDKERADELLKRIYELQPKVFGPEPKTMEDVRTYQQAVDEHRNFIRGLLKDIE